MSFSEFSWPEFLGLLPAYLGALISAVLLFVTLRQIKGARKEADRRAAFKFFHDELENKDFLQLRYNISKIKSVFEDPKIVLDGNHSDEFVSITTYLDKRELLSIGILNGGISEEYSKEIVGRSFIKDTVYFQGFIDAIRMTHEDDGLYKNMLKLSLQWADLDVGKVR